MWNGCQLFALGDGFEHNEECLAVIGTIRVRQDPMFCAINFHAASLLSFSLGPNVGGSSVAR